MKKIKSQPTKENNEMRSNLLNKSDIKKENDKEIIIDENQLKELIYEWESAEDIINELLKKAYNQTDANIKYIEYLINIIDSEKIEIPLLPDIAVKIIQLSQNPDTALEDYAKLVKTDQTIALKIIKLSNSILYKGIREVNDLNLAISRIGIDELKNLVLMLSLQSKIFNIKEFKNIIKEIWNTSLLTALISSKLATYYGLNPSYAYTIGLTHDVGEVVIFNSVKGYQNFYKNKYKPDVFFIKRIAKSFHQKLSAFTLSHWNFSKEQIEIVRKHHDIPDENSNEYQKLLFISYQTAVILLKFKFNENNIENFPYDFIIKYSHLPLKEEAFYLLLKKIIKEFNELINIG
jgi:HD-like signal output (HDOD) protein